MMDGMRMIFGVEILIYIVCIVIMKKYFPYQSAKKHGFIVVSMAMFLVIIYTIERGSHFIQLDSWVSIADNILSGAIFSILCIVFWRFEKKIKNRSEDAKKLRQDYENLAKKYCKNNLIVAKNNDGSEIKYPVIVVGTGKIAISNDNKNIIINDSETDFYKLPSVIENNYVDIFSVHDTSTIYNNVNIRVKDMAIENGQLIMSTERTTYYDSLVTNRASDYEIAEGLSVRELYETGPKMSSLEKSKLSNHLGFNSFVESSDGYIVFVKRSEEMSIAKNTYGDSIGASLKTKYALNDDSRFSCNGLVKAIYGEIKDELEIKKEQIDDKNFYVIALYRDCVECGKPQFLIYAKSTLMAKEISQQFVDAKINNEKNRKKLTVKEKQELKTVKDGTQLIWIRRETLFNHIVYFYDGIGLERNPDINLEGFVSFNEDGLKKLRINRLNMVPSASSALCLLKECLI